LVFLMKIKPMRKILILILLSLSVLALKPVLSFAGLGNDKAPRGGTFYQHMSSEPETLNPITSQDLYSSIIQGYLLESLLTRNIDTYDWQPHLAEKI
jgi:ABC-type transport system substrate-binding protein